MSEFFEHVNSKGKRYHLNTKLVKFGGKERNIYYFSKDKRDTACDLPEGYKVIENQRTGLPMLKKDK